MKIQSDDLFQFEWYVDQHGYEIVENSIESVEKELSPVQARYVARNPPPTTLFEFSDKKYRVIRPLGGPMRYYRPIEEESAIAREFSRVNFNDPDVLKFVNDFGLLMDSKQLRLDIFLDWVKHFKTLYGYFDDGNLADATSFLERNIRIPLVGTIHSFGSKKHGLIVSPTSLVSLMHLEAYKEITGISRFVQCEECMKYFPHRKSKRFCSNKCRQANHREKEANK